MILFFASDSGGWYWDKNKTNQYVDEDNIEKVTKAVTGSSTQALNDRKEYTEKLKKAMNYENCCNKK